jgi:hypothetical protein
VVLAFWTETEVDFANLDEIAIHGTSIQGSPFIRLVHIVYKAFEEHF